MKVKVYLKQDIRVYIARRNKSLMDLAYYVGVSPTLLSMWLYGRKCPSPKHRQRIQRFFGRSKDFDDLFSFETCTTTAK